MEMQAAAATRQDLAERLARLNEEIKSYPQPIARCDAQLAGLLEERDAVRRALEGFAKED
jgi:hypothetical protein